MFQREMGMKVVKVGLAETTSDVAYKPVDDRVTSEFLLTLEF